MSAFQLLNKTKNHLRDNAKGQWFQSYKIKDPNTDGFIHELNGIAMLIRVNYPEMLGFFWMYKMSDAHLLIDYVHQNLHLEAHEIIINDRIKLFYDIDMEITDSELQDMIDYYEEYSNETGLTIDDVSRHLAHLYFDATLASLEEHGNDLEQMQNIVDIMYTTRNRPISSNIGQRPLHSSSSYNDKFKISIHLITNIVCNIQECKAIVEHVSNSILYHPDDYGLDYPEEYCDMIVNAIDVQPYHRFGSLAIYGGRKIVNEIEYINEIQQYFQLKSEEPFITRFDNVPTNISFREYNVINTHSYNSNTTVSKEFIDTVLSHVHKIPYYNPSDWDLDAATYKGCTAIVKRLNPSYCEICERQHDLDNTLILVFNEEWQTGTWKCMHNRNIKSRVFFRDYQNDNELDQFAQTFGQKKVISNHETINSVEPIIEETYTEKEKNTTEIKNSSVVDAPDTPVLIDFEQEYSDSESEHDSIHSDTNRVVAGPDNFLLISEGSAVEDSDLDELNDEIIPNIIIDAPDTLIKIKQDTLEDSESESDEEVEIIYKSVYKYSDDLNVSIDIDDGYESDTDTIKQNIAKKNIDINSKGIVSAAGVLHYQKREYLL